jgi:hypothetical protein
LTDDAFLGICDIVYLRCIIGLYDDLFSKIKSNVLASSKYSFGLVDL